MHRNQFLHALIQSGTCISPSIHIHTLNRDNILGYRENIPIINMDKTLEKWEIFLKVFKQIKKENGVIGIMMDKTASKYYGPVIQNSSIILLNPQWKPGFLSNSSLQLDLIFFFQLSLLDQQSAALEAKRLAIPSAGFISSDMSPNVVDYSFLANTDSYESTKLFLSTLLAV